MELLPELSLGTANCVADHNSSSSESETNPCRKRKFGSDHDHASVDLQFKDTLPLDWEQCLDLESGRMYYLNRKTSRKSWSWPKDQNLDLELNISCSSQSEKRVSCNNNSSSFKRNNPSSCNNNNSSSFKRNNPSSSNMVALACLNCHLLVMLSTSSPSCPNCKYMHSLPFHQDPPRKIPVAVKSLSTLGLLN